ncbi:M16 family metallopeptidase [Ideonella paludis]|uniref:M16 family metallopeptidase n=1 Tax=Ideonella paludis TaxID=1233411 RepID=UPI0036345C5C
MRLKASYVLISLALLSPSLVLAAPAPAPQTLAAVRSVEGITEYRLPNGLQVLLVPDDSKPTTTVNLTYRVGSRHENYGETGMAHLLEHLLFKGTPKNPRVWGSSPSAACEPTAALGWTEPITSPASMPTTKTCVGS